MASVDVFTYRDDARPTLETDADTVAALIAAGLIERTGPDGRLTLTATGRDQMAGYRVVTTKPVYLYFRGGWIGYLPTADPAAMLADLKRHGVTVERTEETAAYVAIYTAGNRRPVLSHA